MLRLEVNNQPMLSTEMTESQVCVHDGGEIDHPSFEEVIPC